MPRMDRTFTDLDLIRFWAKNLDRQERQNVVNFFKFVTQRQTISDRIFLNLFGSIIGIIPIVGDAVDFAIEIGLILDELLTLGELTRNALELARGTGLSDNEIQTLFLIEGEEDEDIGPPEFDFVPDE